MKKMNQVQTKKKTRGSLGLQSGKTGHKALSNRQTEKSSTTEDRKKKYSGGYVERLQMELNRRANIDPKYSLRRFAVDLGVESGALSRILNGIRPLSYKVALRMLGALNFSKEDKAQFLHYVEEQAKALDAGEVSLERRDRVKVVQKKILENLSPEDVKRQEFIKGAKAKIDRCIVKNLHNKTLFVTTAVQGSEVHREFLASIETFLKKKKADLIITTSKAHLKPLSDETYPLDDFLLENYSDCVYRSVELNCHLNVINIDVRPYITDPLAGLAELGAEDGRSYIIAHTQQRMKTYPNGMSSLPRIQQCTGALTLPKYLDNKSGLLADKRHVIGGLVVEIRRDRFHIRVVQADVDGSFVDLGVRYGPDGSVTIERPEALIRGDDHVGFGDPKANCALDEVTAALGPKKIVVHDLMDSASISHHRFGSIKAQLDVPDKIRFLDQELAECRRFLKALHQKKPSDAEIYIVPSNHNEHLHRYLNEGRFIKDIHNYKKAVELAYNYHVLGIDPLIYGVDPDERLATWLKRDSKTVRVCGIAVSSHGDKGPNGSRGGVKADAVSYGRNSSGHSHSPETWRGANRVGTTSVLDLDYTVGSPSSWAHCFELIYQGRDGAGLRQLIFVIDGKWRLEDQPVEKASTKRRKKK